MAWLMTHMWIALAATGLVALVLGWSVRGMMLSGRMRQAMVERDMVKVELGEAKDEIERLFAAQRKLASGEAPAAAGPDPIMARKVESLTAELARKSAEIDALKSSAVAAPVAAIAPAASTAPQVEDNLVWRNRHLESRVVHLESELTKAQAAPAPVAAPAADAPVDAPAPVEAAKQEWEIGYLRTRVEALQAELAAVPAAPVEVVAAVAAAPEVDASVEEEIARLRWRVRFLEGRLAYFEGDAVAADAEEEAADAINDAAEDEMDAPPAKPARMSEAILGQLEAADERAEAEAALQVEKVRPLALDKPVEGQPDDLTLIGGIGPKIQDVLNSLGIFHFDQIADWNAGNIAWVDEYLSFTGRITREGWVEQAAVLVGESADA